MEKEGIPVYEGYSADLKNLKLEPSKRLGALGAWVYLEGCGGATAAYVYGITPGESTKPERHIFDEVIYVLSGQGETTVWYEGQQRLVVKWQEGSMFAPPLNTWHQHFNRGDKEARLVAVTSLPVVMDLYYYEEFIFNNNHLFKNRYAGQADYFSP